MNTTVFLKTLACSGQHRALPILSFPAVQKMNISIRELVNSSDLQAQAMEIIARETPAAASVSLMDLSVEAEAFGATVTFSDTEIPNIPGQLISCSEDVEELAVPAVGTGRTGLCIEAVRLAKQRITDRPVFAGVIGPYSLAGRLMDVTEIMYMCIDEPETVHKVLEKAVAFLILYCKAFRDAGADGVILAEPLAGLLSTEMCKEFSCFYVKQIIDAVQTDDFAVIYHNCGNTVSNMLTNLYALGAAAYHFGNAADMRSIMDKAPADMICMGNIDPVGLFVQGTPDSMANAVSALLNDMNNYPNFILSSGCDIPPHANWDNIHAFFYAAQNFN